MNEKQFHDLTESLFFRIETWLEHENSDIDFETQQGILTITLPNESQILLSQQAQLKEIWLASPLGAYHFQLNANQWLTRRGEELGQILVDIFQKQAGIKLNLAKL
jgi:CyaY protein